MCRIFRDFEQEELLIQNPSHSLVDKSMYLELLCTCLKYINQKVPYSSNFYQRFSHFS